MEEDDSLIALLLAEIAPQHEVNAPANQVVIIELVIDIAIEEGESISPVEHDILGKSRNTHVGISLLSTVFEALAFFAFWMSRY